MTTIEAEAVLEDAKQRARSSARMATIPLAGDDCLKVYHLGPYSWYYAVSPFTFRSIGMVGHMDNDMTEDDAISLIALAGSR